LNHLHHDGSILDWWKFFDKSFHLYSKLFIVVFMVPICRKGCNLKGHFQLSYVIHRGLSIWLFECLGLVLLRYFLASTATAPFHFLFILYISQYFWLFIRSFKTRLLQHLNAWKNVEVVDLRKFLWTRLTMLLNMTIVWGNAFLSSVSLSLIIHLRYLNQKVYQK
jgi:hypothetical protein